MIHSNISVKKKKRKNNKRVKKECCLNRIFILTVSELIQSHFLKPKKLLAVVNAKNACLCFLVLFEDQVNLCFFLSQARAGIISTVEVLKVMEAFVNEPNYTVWSDLSCNLGILSTLLSHTDFYEEIQEFVKDVFSPIGERLGWDPKPGEGNAYTKWRKNQAEVGTFLCG